MRELHCVQGAGPCDAAGQAGVARDSWHWSLAQGGGQCSQWLPAGPSGLLTPARTTQRAPGWYSTHVSPLPPSLSITPSILPSQPHGPCRNCNFTVIKFPTKQISSFFSSAFHPYEKDMRYDMFIPGKVFPPPGEPRERWLKVFLETWPHYPYGLSEIFVCVPVLPIITDSKIQSLQEKGTKWMQLLLLLISWTLLNSSNLASSFFSSARTYLYNSFSINKNLDCGFFTFSTRHCASQDQNEDQTWYQHSGFNSRTWCLLSIYFNFYF